MKKNYFAILILMGLFPFTCNAQAQKIQIGASGGLVVPFVDFADQVQAGYGGSLIFKYFATDHIALGGNVGFYKFPGRELNFGLGFGGLKISQDINIIPINATAEWHIGRSESLRPRIGVDIGAYVIAKQSANNALLQQDSGNKVYFGFAPLVGSGYRISERVEIFADAKFHVMVTRETDDIPTTSYLSVNAGIVFNISE